MAERRMFAKTIVTSDAFLDMPLSARCLYFTLGMFADDDGFVNNPKSIMRQVGASLDDLNVLLLKKFIISFETGVIVIKHWRINNYLQKDRKKSTLYTDEMKLLKIDDEGAYTLGEGRLLPDDPKPHKPLTPAQQKRLDAKKESDLPYSFEYKIKSWFYGKECPICHKIMSSSSKQTMPTIQHNVPISKGGKHEIGNISVICGECNFSTQDKGTPPLNNELVKEVWEMIQNEDDNGNVSGMYTQDSIDKSSNTAIIYNIKHNNIEKNNNPIGLSKKEISTSNINSRSSRSLSLTNTQSENETNIDNVSISFDNAPIGEHSSSNNNNAVTCDIEDPVADAVEYAMRGIKKELDRYVMELFDKTWAIYPRKVSKEQAKKTWVKKMKCCKTPQGVRNKAAQIYKLLMSHIAMWRNEHGDDGDGARPLEYIPHFSSWLNNEIPDD